MLRKFIRGLGWSIVLVVAALTVLAAHVYFEGRPAQGRAQYVAMGSSFASGPAITEAAADSPWFCSRSKDNYAHQLARLRQLSLVDVSCGGATTHHILDGGQLLQPAQIDAVTSETELVTVTIGGNDIGYLGTLMALACDGNTPWYLRRIGACRVRSDDEMRQALVEVRPRLEKIVDEVRRRAPAATVVLVTYPTVLPASGTCARLGIAEADVARIRSIAEALAATTREAAASRGALSMDVRQLTQGHDVCADDPWIVEMHPPRGWLGAPLHPTLEAMSALAGGLNALLDAGPAPTAPGITQPAGS